MRRNLLRVVMTLVGLIALLPSCAGARFRGILEGAIL